MTMDDDTYYQQVDLVPYRQELNEFLPPVVLDFHAHTWLHRPLGPTPWEAGVPGGSYMIVNTEYGWEAMEVAHELQLVIMLHLPRSLRLADPLNIASLRRLSAAYPGAQIVVAHAGRSYCPSTMRGGIGPLRVRPNVFFEVSMVQEPLVIQILLDHVDSQRVFFGTDLPVAAMRGRRVCMNDRWVDVVREPDQGSAFRLSAHCRDSWSAIAIVPAHLHGLRDRRRCCDLLRERHGRAATRRGRPATGPKTGAGVRPCLRFTFRAGTCWPSSCFRYRAR